MFKVEVPPKITYFPKKGIFSIKHDKWEQKTYIILKKGQIAVA